MNQNNTIAIVGPTNVGKSSLFNRIIKQRKSIVDDQSGVTRDRIYGVGEWLTKSFNIIDTGGLTFKNTKMQKAVELQTEIAIIEASVIIFLVDIECLVDNNLFRIARILHKSNSKVILAVNKIDRNQHYYLENNFNQLGFGTPIELSIIHGIGIGDILDKIIESLPIENKNYVDDNTINLAVIGRPNVGKSSLVNSILNDDRCIVSEEMGTTRDSTNTKLNFNATDFNIIDTAGIRNQGKITAGIEKYSVLRSEKVIEQADVVILLIDISEDVVDLDTNIAGRAVNKNKIVIITANKWDKLKNLDKNTIRDKMEKVEQYFKFIKFADIIFISVIENKNINKLMNLVIKNYKNSTKRIKTSSINEVINRLLLVNPPSKFKGGIFNIYYVSQVAISPPTFVLFVNNPNYLHFSYQRYIENQLRDNFDFSGIPIKLKFKRKV